MSSWRCRSLRVATAICAPSAVGNFQTVMVAMCVSSGVVCRHRTVRRRRLVRDRGWSSAVSDQAAAGPRREPHPAGMTSRREPEGTVDAAVARDSPAGIPGSRWRREPHRRGRRSPGRTVVVVTAGTTRERVLSARPSTTPPTAKQRREAGRARREVAPLESHAEFRRPKKARDAVTLLEEQSADRVPELVPIRYGRMLQSAFTFYRGAARVMAADLAQHAAVGPGRADVRRRARAQLRLLRLARAAAGVRRQRLRRDPAGPFEFDVKRLVASLVVAGRDNGLSRKRCRAVAVAAGASYRTAMAEFAGARDLEVWYSHIDVDELQQRFTASSTSTARKRLDRAAWRRPGPATPCRPSASSPRSSTAGCGMRADPPLIVPLRDLLPDTEGRDLSEAFGELVADYRSSLQVDRRTLLERYTLRRHGPQGRRCRQRRHPLLGGPARRPGRERPPPAADQGGAAVGARGVRRPEPVRRTRASAWCPASASCSRPATSSSAGSAPPASTTSRATSTSGSSGTGRAPLTIEELRPEGLQIYGEVCAWMPGPRARPLRRPHRHRRVPRLLATFEHAVAEFAETYADVNATDHGLLAAAAATGRVPVAAG